MNNIPSEFKELKGIEYFNFEEDFVAANIRCIPMIVRFKMDAAGVKLKLGQWSKFHPDERIQLALMSTATRDDIKVYHEFLVGLINQYTGKKATELAVDPLPDWGNLHQVPTTLKEKSEEFDLKISIGQWQNLSDMQRFALLKLCRPGHGNKNFPKAIVEFGLSEN